MISSSPLGKSSVISSPAARLSAARSPSARDSVRQVESSAPHRKLPSSRCGPPHSAFEALDQEITALDHELAQLVAAAAPRTVQLLGISTGHAGQLLVTARQNIERLRSESSFAMLCGASPIPASSGKTTRHRLNYGGDRQANRALHLIAVCRLRYCQRTRAYVNRRTAEGKTQREIMRCLKRYIAREVFNSLRADLADSQPPRPPVTTTIICGTPGFGITRKRT